MLVVGWLSLRFTPYVLPLLGAAALSFGLVALAWRRRQIPGAACFAVLMLAIGELTLAYAFEVMGTNLQTKLLLDEIEYIGIVANPVAAVIFALHYTGRERAVTPMRLGMAALIPSITLILLWANPTHGLVQIGTSVDPSGPFPALVITHGPWFWIHIIYSYGMLFTSMILLIDSLLRSPQIYRSQVLAMLIAILAPLLSNITFLARLAPSPHLDLTPFAFTVTGLVMFLALFRMGFLDLILGLPLVARAVLVNRMPDAVILTNSRGTIVEANPIAMDVLGQSEPGVIGQPIDKFLPGWSDWKLNLTPKQTDNVEVSLGPPDNDRHYDLLMAPQYLGGKYLAGWVLVLRDVTAYLRIQRDLLETNRRLEAALTELRETQEQVVQQERLRALGQMASGIAHDFNNDLAVIAGFLELLTLLPLEDGREAEKIRSYLASMSTAVTDATNVIRRLREFYRPRFEGERIVASDLNALVRQTQELTHPRWKVQSQAKGITIDLVTDLGDIPPIAGNPAQLREALTNLIFNAVDALPDGGTIAITTELRADQARLRVRDTGVGMTEEVRRRCLDPFFTTKGPEGSGMGLAMAYGIIQRHGGSIDVASDVGQGTIITVNLPLAPSEVAREVPVPSPVPVGESGKILLVEDLPRLRELFSIHLTEAGHTVETAVNGRQGLEKFLQNWYDLIITDLAMDEMNGDQLARAIRQRAPAKPIILLTGMGDLLTAANESLPDVTLVLGKPITAAALNQAVARVLAMEPGESPRATSSSR